MLSFSYFITSETEDRSWPSVYLPCPSGCTPNSGLAGVVSDSQLPLPPHQRSPESLRVQAGRLARPGTQCSPLALEPCPETLILPPPPSPRPTEGWISGSLQIPA